MDMNYFSIEIKPITDCELDVRMVTNVNAKLKFIPLKIVNYVSRKFVFFCSYFIIKI